MLAADHRALDQSGPLENLDVFGDAVERNRELAGDFAHVDLAAGKHGQDGPARRIGDCTVDVVEVAFNHLVEYYHGATLEVNRCRALSIIPWLPISSGWRHERRF